MSACYCGVISETRLRAAASKKTLLRSLEDDESPFKAEILGQTNELSIGPMGLGGDITAFRDLAFKRAPITRCFLWP